MKVKDMSETVKAALALRWAAEAWSMGDETAERNEKPMKQEGVSYLLCENRGRTSEANFVHTASQNIGAEQRWQLSKLKKGWKADLFPQLSYCLPTPSQPPSSPFLEEKTLSLLSSLFSVGERYQAVEKAVMEMLQGWGVSPAKQVLLPLGSPVQAVQTTQVSWHRCGDPQCMMLMAGHPSWVLEQQRFRNPYCSKLASEQ